MSVHHSRGGVSVDYRSLAARDYPPGTEDFVRARESDRQAIRRGEPCIAVGVVESVQAPDPRHGRVELSLPEARAHLHALATAIDLAEQDAR